MFRLVVLVLCTTAVYSKCVVYHYDLQQYGGVSEAEYNVAMKAREALCTGMSHKECTVDCKQWNSRHDNKVPCRPGVSVNAVCKWDSGHLRGSASMGGDGDHSAFYGIIGGVIAVFMCMSSCGGGSRSRE